MRFVHAVPGAGQAELQISSPKGGGTSVGRAAFGEATPYRGVESGPIAWRLVGAGQGKVLATGRAMLRDGSYTVVALTQGSGAALAFLRDQAGVPGAARLRLVHGAPELGAPDLRLDGRIVARGVRFTQATPYLLVRPGTHSVAVTPPGHASPVVRRDGIRLLAGEAATGLVLGTSGQRTRIVALRDGGSRASSHRLSSRRAAPRASTPARRAAGGGAGARMVTVRRGDSLWSIAQRRLGLRPPAPGSSVRSGACGRPTPAASGRATRTCSFPGSACASAERPRGLYSRPTSWSSASSSSSCSSPSSVMEFAPPG